MSVLEAEPPRFSPEQAAELAAELFGVSGSATALGSERDQAFLIEDGAGGGVLKISNSGEDPAVLDLEREAVLHVGRVDPELPVAQPTPAVEAQGHLVRLFSRLQGRHWGPELPDDAVRAYAATHARLNLALRGFFHPAAARHLLWDLKNAPGLRPLLEAVHDESRRRLLERVLDRFEERVVPLWPRLRAQVVHGDFNLDNILLDEQGRVSGIVDFGDVTHSAQAGDFAVALASLLRGRTEDDLFRVARIAIDGYASLVPFEAEELGVLGDLVTARLAAIVAISAWRAERYPENRDYIELWDADSWTLLETFDALGADEVSYRLGAVRPAVATKELAARRGRVLGPALTALTYDRPVHVVRGEGVWLFEADGTRLLDAYNNVPVVGHCHPRVTEAVVRQTRLLNTHARYLYEPLVELGERLVASMPPGTGLDTVLLVNSGSEANELAWRLALAATGNRGAVVTEHAYHGVTTAIADLSPEEWPAGNRPEHVETVVPPAEGLAEAIERLDARGFGLAATFLDTAFTSDGVHIPARPSCGRWSSRHARRAASSSRTRCRPGTAASAASSGRSRAMGSRRTWSRSASQWGTGIRSRRSLRAASTSSGSRRRRASSAPSAEPGRGPGRSRRARRSEDERLVEQRRRGRRRATAVSRGARGGRSARRRCAPRRRRARTRGARRGRGQRHA
jgi:Ser/Thr protein kinase RdoA (MazF antagonist)